MKPEVVCNEVARMMGVEEADQSTPGFFSMRLPAIKRILDRMTPGEHVELEREMEKVSQEGYPEEIKRK